MESIYQRLTIKGLIDMALSNPEPGAVNFNILQRALFCILKELNIENSDTDYYKFNDSCYLIPSKSEFEDPVLKVVRSSPALFQKTNLSISGEDTGKIIVSPSSISNAIEDLIDAVENSNTEFATNDEVFPNGENLFTPSKMREVTALQEDQQLSYTKSSAQNMRVQKSDQSLEEFKDVYHRLGKISDEMINKIEQVEKRKEINLSEAIQKLDNKIDALNVEIQQFNISLEQLEKNIKDFSIIIRALKKDRTLSITLKQIEEDMKGYSSSIAELRQDITNILTDVKRLDSEKASKKDFDELKMNQVICLKEIEDKVNSIDFHSTVRYLKEDLQKFFSDLSHSNIKNKQSIVESKRQVEADVKRLECHLLQQENFFTDTEKVISNLLEKFLTLSTSVEMLKKNMLISLHRSSVTSAGTKTCVSCGRPAILSGGECLRQERMVPEEKPRYKSLFSGQNLGQFKENAAKEENTYTCLSHYRPESIFKETKKSVYVPSGCNVLALDGTLYKDCKLEKETDKVQIFSFESRE